MGTALKKNRSIEENLKDPEFVKSLREHPIIENKVERAKKNLAAMKAIEHVKEKDTRN
ncbi:hypothetical protein [Spirosoma arcticum]